MAITKKQKLEILALLAEVYKDSSTALIYQTPFQLLIATLLAAQTTDVQVNKATGPLFERYPDPHSMAGVTPETIIPYIRSLGFYRMKAKHVAGLAEMLITDFGGAVPETREELMKLPGVGRKTANVVLSNAFHIPAMAVDTHVFRVSNRMGLVSGSTPDEVEEQLCRLVPEKDWSDGHHWLIWHGRRCCKAQRPLCEDCPVGQICPRIMTGQNKSSRSNRSKAHNNKK
ncbi:MAG: endonuclease III [Peptococcaceae bacterium]|jgi:endonuclease-3|nr:endonuclease III [Peptococcaceae bacterium]